MPVAFHEFAHPEYPQHGKRRFLPDMSIIDALFNIGPNGIMDLIKNSEHGKD